VLTTRGQKIFVWVVVPVQGTGSLLAYVAYGGQKFLNAALLSALALLLAATLAVRNRLRR
jgi:hypothetical protein